MQSNILVMSLAGSLTTILCFIIFTIANRFLTSRWKYSMLKMNLLFFLFPFPLIKNYLLIIIRLFVSDFGTASKVPTIIQKERILQITSNQQMILPIQPRFLACLLIVWLSGFLIILILHMYSYFKLKKYYIKNSVVVTNVSILKTLDMLKKPLHIRKNIVMVTCNYEGSPFTIGLFKPMIVLPKTELKSDQMLYIFKHELIHIKQKDFLVRLLGIFVVALHWFNPLAYVFNRAIALNSEYACDEKVVLNLEHQQRQAYGNTILDMSIERITNLHRKNIFINSIGNMEEKYIKERLIKIIKVKKLKLCAYLISGILSILLVATSLMTVFAYSDPVIIVNEVSTESLFRVDEVTLHSVQPYVGVEDITQTVTEVDEYFTDQKGNTFKVSFDERAACNHVYSDGELSTHTRNSKGGCKTDYYNAKYCDLCSHCIRGSKFYTENYDVCPH